MVPDYIYRCVTFSPGQGQILAEKPVREIHNLLELQRAHGNLIFSSCHPMTDDSVINLI